VRFWRGFDSNYPYGRRAFAASNVQTSPARTLMPASVPPPFTYFARESNTLYSREVSYH